VVCFPFKVKLIFGIDAVTAPNEWSGPLVKLYIASAWEQTAPLQGAGLVQKAGFPGISGSILWSLPIRELQSVEEKYTN
jgi:hypothetical protein